MKMLRSILFLSILATLAYSCTVRQLDEAVSPLPDDTELTFTATMENEALTRSTLSDNYSFRWSPGEQVNLFYGNGGNTPGSLFVSQNTEPSSSAVFKGRITAFTGGGEGSASLTFWSISPYSQSNRCDGVSVQATLPTVQQAVRENLADNTMLMVANAPGLTLSYLHVGTFLRVCVTNPDIVAITFTGNSGEIVGGRVSVTMDTSGKPAWSPIEGEGSTSVRLEGPDGGCFIPGNYYLLTFLPQTFQNGWSLVFEKSDGTVGKYTKTGSATFVRASSKNASNRDVDLTYIPMYVEMGPGVVWGTMNIGAYSPDGYGSFFAWGETAPKAFYGNGNYRYGEYSAYTKYVTDRASGTMDGRQTLLPEDDAASVRLGSEWRMPTQSEWAWLLNVNNCTWTESTSVNGVNGYTVTSKVSGYEGNSIFLPNAGRQINDVVSGTGQFSMYWTASVAPDLSAGAYFAGSNSAGADSRYVGRSVRAVRMPRVPVSSFDIGPGQITVGVEMTKQLYSVTTPSNPTEPGAVWTSSNPSVAIVDYNGIVTGVSPGTATISAVSIDDGFQSSTCTVTVIESFVDMGGGMEWATLNIGADGPTEYGKYYAWGEALTKSFNKYTWDGYKLGWEGNMTSYNSTDGLFTLQTNRDVAYKRRGGQWHIPTADEWYWLASHSTVVEKTIDNIKGVEVTSNITGNKIFLPYAGRVYSGGVQEAGVNGGYWSSNVVQGNEEYASIAFVHPTAGLSVNMANPRYYGLPVRPVRRKAVDMGNGLKWAITNVGGFEPEDSGDYFAWGEVHPKEEYSWSTYKWTADGTQTGLNQYVTQPGFAVQDNRGILLPADDAASANWGGSWRMPQINEWIWLAQNCTWTRTIDYEGTGVTGHIVHSNVNGNEIFLPAAGLYVDSSLEYNGPSNANGYYWSSRLYDPLPSTGQSLTTGNRSTFITYRVFGMSVRAVSND
jgi:uncharacterized protein (TIGR02145 family)